MYQLLPFNLTTKPIFDAYVKSIKTLLSDYSFANNFVWLTPDKGHFIIIEDCFCLFELDDDELSMALPPLGNCHSQCKAFPICIEILARYNKPTTPNTINFAYYDFLNVLSRIPIQLIIDDGYSDYVYLTKDLIELKGNKYKSKRNAVNSFKKKFPDYRIETLNISHYDKVMCLLDEWIMLHAGANQFNSIQKERKAIMTALQFLNDLKLTGLCLFVKDRLVGFTIGESLSSDTASVLFEKTDLNFGGAAQFIFREFANVFKDHTYINVGDDLGLVNLQRVKTSYHPVNLNKKLTICYDSNKNKIC